MLPISLLYASLLGLLMAILSIRVPMRRGALNVPFGDGNDEQLATRIRAFGNFTEYAPMVVVLLALLENAGVRPALLHGLGVAFVASRLLHAVVYRARPELTTPLKIGRGIAAMSTWLVLVAGAGTAAWLSFA